MPQLIQASWRATILTAVEIGRILEKIENHLEMMKATNVREDSLVDYELKEAIAASKQLVKAFERLYFQAIEEKEDET